MGNPVLTGNSKVYMIYYGAWSAAEIALTNDFVSGLGASSWYAVNNKYYYQPNSGSSKVYVNVLSLGGSVVDAFSRGKALSGNDVPLIIEAQLASGALPVDPEGMYMVAISRDVTEDVRADLGTASMCLDYCGYHVSWVLPCSGKRIFYGIVTNTDACPYVCAVQTTSPNGLPGTDGMLSLLAHGIVEAVTDPYSDVGAMRAWQDAMYWENADKCSWNFGPTNTLPSGAEYNLGATST